MIELELQQYLLREYPQENARCELWLKKSEGRVLWEQNNKKQNVIEDMDKNDIKKLLQRGEWLTLEEKLAKTDCAQVGLGELFGILNYPSGYGFDFLG